MRRTRIILQASLAILLLATSTPLAGQKHSKKTERAEAAANLPAVIWRDPGDISTLNLLYGIGGSEDAPDPSGKYTFREEDMNGTSPKFDVEDEHGVRWRAKLGDEPQSETAATRLLWAAGYFVDEDYYLPEIKVTGLPKLHRGQGYISTDGTVRRVRLKRRPKSVKKIGTWSWFANPFVGTKEFNGLRVMMALINNWDLKQENNAIYATDVERRYLVSDLGASFGKTGDSIGRSKSVPKDYVNSKFIDKVAGDHVDFVMHSRPFILSVFNVPNYANRTHMQSVTKHIPRADAKWLGQRLSQLSAEQIRDCFRAGGYTSEEVESYAEVVRKRIEELNTL
ncbi:MAG TPA: hypothetical protein VOA64_17950 [Candidatus Dormibacteraeota bacterium]|nr:hypothetical protein [Candidatus Dormibacteraeota bacterium]